MSNREFPAAERRRFGAAERQSFSSTSQGRGRLVHCQSLRRAQLVRSRGGRDRTFSFGLGLGTLDRFFVALFCIVALGLTGCATPPKKADIIAFAATAEAVGGKLEGAFRLPTEIVIELEATEEATNYLRKDNAFNFPPEAGGDITGRWGRIDDGLWKDRLAVIRALTAYSEALVALQDPASLDRLDASIKGLLTSTTSFATAVGQPVPQITQVSEPAVAIVRMLTANYLAKAAHKRIRQADPLVQEAVGLLLQDLSSMQALADANAAILSAKRVGALKAARNNGSASNPELYDNYRQVLEEHRRLESSLAVYNQSGALLAKMAEAHGQLANSPDAPSVNDFMALAVNVGSVVSLARSSTQ